MKKTILILLFYSACNTSMGQKVKSPLVETAWQLITITDNIEKQEYNVTKSFSRLYFTDTTFYATGCNVIEARYLLGEYTWAVPIGIATTEANCLMLDYDKIEHYIKKCFRDIAYSIDADTLLLYNRGIKFRYLRKKEP